MMSLKKQLYGQKMKIDKLKRNIKNMKNKLRKIKGDA